MFLEEKENEKNKINIRETISIDNEEQEKENEDNKNIAFNLEYQKIVNTSDGQTKITYEIKKLIDFVRERYFYKDINGNRITPKGELLPTPFQKLQKINEEIKSYYENKLNRKNSPLIVENYKNKNINSSHKNNTLNSLSSKNRLKEKNFLPLKITKNLEKINLNKRLTNNKTLDNKGIQNNFTPLTMSNFKKPYIKLNKKENEKHNKISFSESFKRSKTKYFYDSHFNQINFWKTRLLYPQLLNKNKNKENEFENNSRFKNFITEYNKRNNENDIKSKINMGGINKVKNYKSLRSKTFTKDLNKYELMQFNINQLIKRDLTNKDKIVLNIRKSHDNLVKKIMKNKIINVNMDKIKILDYYK